LTSENIHADLSQLPTRLAIRDKSRADKRGEQSIRLRQTARDLQVQLPRSKALMPYALFGDRRQTGTKYTGDVHAWGPKRHRHDLRQESPPRTVRDGQHASTSRVSGVQTAAHQRHRHLPPLVKPPDNAPTSRPSRKEKTLGRGPSCRSTCSVRGTRRWGVGSLKSATTPPLDRQPPFKANFQPRKAPRPFSLNGDSGGKYTPITFNRRQPNPMARSSAAQRRRGKTIGAPFDVHFTVTGVRRRNRKRQSPASP